MFFKLLNNNQNSIAASVVLVLGIVQISLDAWSLYKINQHETLIYFLSGNTVGSSEMRQMTYEQALSYLQRLERYLHKDLLEVLVTLQMACILGIVAGILQLFSSVGALMWGGSAVDVFWLIMNFIGSIFLAVAVAYISNFMIKDVPYHQVLLTVTAVNLFILCHIWVLNMTALIQRTFFKGKESQTPTVESVQANNASSSASRP